MEKNEVDIIGLHKQMLQMFIDEENKIDTYTKDLNTLSQLIKQPHHLHSARIILEKSKQNLEQKLKDIISCKSKNFYIMETAEIIEEYEKILRKPLKVSFIGVVSVDEETVKLKRQLVKKFLDISKKYDLNIIHNVKLDKKHDQCENCKNSDLYELNGFRVCIACGHEIQIPAASSSYKDVERVNVGSKYTYDKRIHFRDCINQYQGKQNSTINNKVYEDLEKQFYQHGLLVKSNDKHVKFSKITKKHILLFLKESGHSKHYEDAVLIHYNLTGIKPPDISHLEAKIIADFDKLVETYEKNIKGKNIISGSVIDVDDRKNFINNQYVLYQLLKKYKYNCDITEFNILKTLERQKFHDLICELLFKELGWNFTSVF